MVDSEEELKNPLMKVKEESEKADFKHSKNEDHGLQSHHLWEIDEEKMETVTDFISFGSKITTDCKCNHEIKTLAP